MSEETGFGTNLDYSRLDEFSAAERETLFRWYGETHGADASDLSLVPFVPFLADHRPGALKRWRRFAEALGSKSSLPQPMVALLFLHLYIVLCNDEGIRYEVIAAREWGANREEVLDTINYGFLHAGPFGMNVAARSIGDLLADWPTDAGSNPTSAWPTGAAANSPPQHAVPDGVRPELAAREWLHLAAVEAHVDRVADSLRALPPQAGPLFLIHLGVSRANESICEYAAREAARLDVSRALFEEAALWGLAYGGDVGLELAWQATRASAK